MDGSAIVFYGVIIVVGMLSAAMRDRMMLRTCLTLLGCAVAGIIWRMLIAPDDQWPWLAYAVIDIVGAYIVTRRRACRWQGWIGLCFLIQFAMNIGYGAAYLDQGYSYDSALLAWENARHITDVKLLLLGAWGGLSFADLIARRSRLFPASPPHFRGAGKAR